jgi:2-oxoglutarate dehydrogenase E2 component (dihydrolipoamide succinyltransferase)
MPAKIVVPELGESVVEATVGRWLKKEGERVSVGEPLVALETDKIDLEVGAERGGVLARIERKEGEDVRIGDVLGLIEEAPAAAPGKEAAEPPTPAAPVAAGLSRQAQGAVKPPLQPAPAPVAAGGAPHTQATPLARRVAEAHGIDLAKVSPGDQGGRIRQRDVEKFLEKQAEAAPPRAAAPSAQASVAKPVQRFGAPEDRSGLEERVRMSRRRQTIARRLVEAQHTAAMLTTFNEADMSAVVELRRRHKEEFKQKHGVGLGVTSFFVKAAVSALREFPRLNAEIQGEEMVLKHYYDIGVAVGAADGLVVPVLRDADQMSFVEIERAIKEFARKAEESSFTLDDLSGGTFTISNGGIFGSLLSTPILNPPQSAILGLHKIEERAVPHQGQVVIRPMMYLALSYDHRIVDGLEAVRFLVRIKELAEEPGDLLLET